MIAESGWVVSWRSQAQQVLKCSCEETPEHCHEFSGDNELVVAAALQPRGRADLRAGKKPAQASTRGHVFIHRSLYLADFREH